LNRVQRHWEHTLRDECDLVRHMDCIHFNPVKHGYVTPVVECRSSNGLILLSTVWWRSASTREIGPAT
jgi:hypothetical protein